jgi:hypothetical protein
MPTHVAFMEKQRQPSVDERSFTASIPPRIASADRVAAVTPSVASIPKTWLRVARAATAMLRMRWKRNQPGDCHAPVDARNRAAAGGL